MNYLIDTIKQNLENVISKRDVQYYYSGKPDLSKVQWGAGAIMVSPVEQDVTAVTTGIIDEETNTIEIILGKSMQKLVNRNAQEETSEMFLVRVMCGQDGSGNLLTTSVRYVIRNIMKQYGVMQEQVNIKFDDNKLNVEGCVSATMTVTWVQHTNQPI